MCKVKEYIVCIHHKNTSVMKQWRRWGGRDEGTGAIWNIIYESSSYKKKTVFDNRANELYGQYNDYFRNKEQFPHSTLITSYMLLAPSTFSDFIYNTGYLLSKYSVMRVCVISCLSAEFIWLSSK